MTPFPSAEGRDTQKRLKALNAAVLRLSRNIKELQAENQRLKEDLGHVLSSSPPPSKTKSTCLEISECGAKGLGTSERCVTAGPYKGRNKGVATKVKVQDWQSWNENLLSGVSDFSSQICVSSLIVPENSKLELVEETFSVAENR